MELFDAIRGRRSIRAFLDKPVEDEKIGWILEACRWAPSAGNRQPWEIIIVKDHDVIESLSRAAYDQDWISMAPVVLVVCINERIARSKYGERGQMYALESIGCAVQNMMLVAHSLGLGSCFVGAFEEDEIKKILGCPGHINPVALLPIGYPAEKPETPERVEVPQFTYIDKYGKSVDSPEWKGLLEYGKRIKRKVLRTLKKI